MESAVLSRMIRDCRTGMDKRRPVIWIRTSEMELVRRIIKSEELVPNLRNTQRNGWTPPADAQKDRLVWGALDSAHNIKLASIDELSKYFSKTAISELSSIKNPPHLFVAKADCLSVENADLSFWEKIIPFIDAYVADDDEDTPLGRSAVILFSERISIPADYVPYCHVIEELYPKKAEITELVSEGLGKIEGFNADIIDMLANEMMGFSLIRAEEITAYIRRLFGDPYSRRRIEKENETKKNEKDRITPRRIIIDERAQELKRSDLLTLMETEDSEIAGIEAFERWMEEQEIYLSQAQDIESELNVRAPKGVLLCGIPGTGKSAMAKKFAHTTGMKLIRMDVGKLMGSYVGESEHNMQKALKIVDATAPCVLFIDELDKSFEGAKAGSSGSSSDSTLRRMFATLLTWMQDHRSPCFVFATANDISALPKEFFRSGRFDCMFALFMPTFDECVKIFEHHIQKRIGDNGQTNGLKAPYLDFSAQDLAQSFMAILEAGERFVTGADIEKLTEQTLRRAYNEQNKEFTSCFENRTRVQKSELENIFKAIVGDVTPSGTKDGVREIRTSVYGDSKEQLDSIALCYIRLLRNNFVPITNNPMFVGYTAQKKKNDTPEDDQQQRVHDWLEFDVDVKLAEMSRAYDKKLQEKIYERIKAYAPKYEQEALKKMF